MHINAVSAYIIWRAVCVSSRYSYIHNRLIMCLHAVTWKENPNTFFTSVRGVALSGDKTLGMRLHFSPVMKYRNQLRGNRTSTILIYVGHNQNKIFILHTPLNICICFKHLPEISASSQSLHSQSLHTIAL